LNIGIELVLDVKIGELIGYSNTRNFQAKGFDGIIEEETSNSYPTMR
jgi:hypothetical protein